MITDDDDDELNYRNDDIHMSNSHADNIDDNNINNKKRIYLMELFELIQSKGYNNQNYKINHNDLSEEKILIFLYSQILIKYKQIHLFDYSIIKNISIPYVNYALLPFHITDSVYPVVQKNKVLSQIKRSKLIQNDLYTNIKNNEKFSLLSQRLLEILTYKIFCCFLLFSQDHLFVIRGIQILLFHSMKIYHIEKYNYINKKANECLYFLIKNNLNIVRCIHIGNLIVKKNISIYSAQTPNYFFEQNETTSTSIFDGNKNDVYKIVC
jgi:hypothetical protein